MELDIVLLPPKKLSRQIGNIVRSTGARYGFSVVVDDRKLLPHITLLHIKSSQAKLPRIALVLKTISLKYKKLRLDFGTTFERNLYFHYRISNTAKLCKLHEEVVKTVSSLRTGIVRLPKNPKNQVQRKYFKLYGVGIVLRFFNPHFTLGKLKNPVHKNEVTKFLNSKFLPKFTVDRLAVAQADRHHQVTKIIKEFKLK